MSIIVFIYSCILYTMNKHNKVTSSLFESQYIKYWKQSLMLICLELRYFLTMFTHYAILCVEISITMSFIYYKIIKRFKKIKNRETVKLYDLNVNVPSFSFFSADSKINKYRKSYKVSLFKRRNVNFSTFSAQRMLLTTKFYFSATTIQSVIQISKSFSIFFKLK